MSLGIHAGDATSMVTVTKTFTPEEVDEEGNVTPAKTVWSAGDPGPVTFTFMTRPGSDAVYLTGWRITRYDFNGRVSTEVSSANKIDIYVPSGWTCPERTSLPNSQSCQMYTTDGRIRNDVQPANGLPIGDFALTFADDLIEEVERTDSSAYSVVDIEFTGESSNGQPVVVKASNISNRALKAGDE